jgi:L-seryl-tRNA(Ser) seleniumtransferase
VILDAGGVQIVNGYPVLSHVAPIMSPNPLRSLPSVHELLESPTLRSLVDRISHNAVVSTVRTVLDEVRHEVQTAASERSLPSAGDLVERIARRIVEGEPAVLRPVVNATGHILESGLGPAPLAEEAIAEMSTIARNYASLELNLVTGRPARRHAAIEDLLRELTGGEAALVVNNNAGATMLALAALGAGREVIVSRGQLIEIGDGCRLPDLIAAGGAVLHEVGATNKTRSEDYAEAINESTAALLLVHPGNFAVVGATESVTLEELVRVGQQRKLPVIHDIGAAAMIDFRQFNLPGQPLVADSIKAGADLVLTSGDKLLGGPPCGIILGRKALIEKIERHPMARTLLADKGTLAALAATLRLYRDPQQARLSIPLLNLLTTSAENLKNRAERLAPQAAATAAIAAAEAVPDATCLGWGFAPTDELPTWCVALRPAAMSVERLAAALRMGAPSVVGRIRDDRLLLDLRSVLPRQDVELIAALEALGQSEATAEPSIERL